MLVTGTSAVGMREEIIQISMIHLTFLVWQLTGTTTRVLVYYVRRLNSDIRSCEPIEEECPSARWKRAILPIYTGKPAPVIF